MQRHERLEKDIKASMSHIISYEVKEPEVTGMISVTSVKVTPDQKYMTVYVSIYGKKNKEKVLDALKKAKGFIKSSLAKKVKMRNIPEITFKLDNSMEYGEYMDKVIDEVIKKDNEISNKSINEE